MNKGEIKNLEAIYKRNYLAFKVFEYDKTDHAYSRVIGMKELLNTLNIDSNIWENDVILENYKSLIETWQDIQGYIKIKNTLTSSKYHIEFILDELQYFSESEKQTVARKEVIRNFINSLESKNIVVPEM